jgi:uncharacterized protein YfiM (DUF2279 family)
MRAFALILTLHFGGGGAGADRWFGPDKAKHFFMAAFVQSVSFGGFRTAGLSRNAALIGATVTTSAVSVGKELYDARTGGDPSLKDLTWDVGGMLAAGLLLHRTPR